MSKRRHWSLRRRLLLWLLVPLVGLAGGMLYDARLGAVRAADRAYDRVLGASALAIAERIVIGDEGPEVDIPYVAFEMLGSTAHDRVYYRISGPGDRFITGYSDLPAPSGPLSVDDEPRFSDAVYRGEAVRIATLVQPVIARTQTGTVRIEIAQTRGERTLLADDLLYRSAERFALMIVVAGAVAWLAVTNGLAPLDRLRDAILGRSRTDLTPIEADVPREVQHVVGAINQFMERLAASLAAMERFIADASHQLRTPLASLQTQAELALRVDDAGQLRDSFLRLLITTRRTSRLAEQLLTQARVTGGGIRDTWRPLALAGLVAEVARACVPAAAARDIDLGVERAEADAWVVGDAVLLRETVKNLIDNAVRYGRPGGVINLRVDADDDRVALEVEDDGPGIPAVERERVFERFYRVAGSGEGSGLGLAIVRDVVERHGGTVVLGDGIGSGLLVRIELPRANAGTRSAA